MKASMTMPSRLLNCELMSTPHADIFHLLLNHSSTLRSRRASRVSTLVYPCRFPGSLPTLYVIFRPNFRIPGDGCTQSTGFGPHRCAIARPSELQGILKHIKSTQRGAKVLRKTNGVRFDAVYAVFSIRVTSKGQYFVIMNKLNKRSNSPQT